MDFIEYSLCLNLVLDFKNIWCKNIECYIDKADYNKITTKFYKLNL